MTTDNDARWLGPPDAAPVQPCVGCGRRSTPLVTALTVSGRGRFTAELQHLCWACVASDKITHITKRLADPTLHPEARPYVLDALGYWQTIRGTDGNL